MRRPGCATRTPVPQRRHACKSSKSQKSNRLCRRKSPGPRKRRCLLDTHTTHIQPHPSPDPSPSRPSIVFVLPSTNRAESLVSCVQPNPCMPRRPGVHLRLQNVTTTVQQNADHVRTTAQGKELRTASTPGSSCRTTEPSGGLYVVCEWNH